MGGRARDRVPARDPAGRLEPELVRDPGRALGSGRVVEALGGSLSGAVPTPGGRRRARGRRRRSPRSGPGRRRGRGPARPRRGRSSAPSRPPGGGEVPVEAGVAEQLAPRASAEQQAVVAGAMKRRKKARLRSSSILLDLVEALVGGDQRQQLLELLRADRLDPEGRTRSRPTYRGRLRRARLARQFCARPQGPGRV